MGCPTPSDIFTAKFLHVNLWEHCGGGHGKIAGARGPSQMPYDSVFYIQQEVLPMKFQQYGA